MACHECTPASRILRGVWNPGEPFLGHVTALTCSVLKPKTSGFYNNSSLELATNGAWIRGTGTSNTSCGDPDVHLEGAAFVCRRVEFQQGGGCSQVPEEDLNFSPDPLSVTNPPYYGTICNSSGNSTRRHTLYRKMRCMWHMQHTLRGSWLASNTRNWSC